MNNFEIIKQEWMRAFAESAASPVFRGALEGRISVTQYKGILRQIFHHARENPQIQALATVYFRGEQREMVRPFFRHAISEIGHDKLAMNDLAALGEDVSRLPHERPLPATLALLGYAFYQIQFRNPVGYLGYLFHLEFMPTQQGQRYMDILKENGVPPGAMTFLEEHARVDVGHNKLMEEYVKALVVTDDDLESVIHAASVTATLYVNMLEEAMTRPPGAGSAEDRGRTRSERGNQEPALTRA